MAKTKELIAEGVKTAMKAKEQQKLVTLRGVMAAIKQYEVDQRKEPEESEVISIIQKEIKKRKEALHYAEEQKRIDLIEQNRAELEILQGYLGKQLSDEELNALIAYLIGEGADSLGKIMGLLNKDHKGAFDGKKASQLAHNLLSAAKN